MAGVQNFFTHHLARESRARRVSVCHAFVRRVPAADRGLCVFAVYFRDRGLIFISHRFSTVRRANRILVFHEGNMSEDGTHDELIALGGEYAKLYAEQAKWYL